MDITAALEFARPRRNGVLATLKRDGRPQLSNITYALNDDLGVVEVSITADRAKFANLARDPRASLHVTQDDFWGWVVIEGDVTLLPVAADPHDDTVEALIGIYRRAAGEHPDWDDYRRAMVAQHRTLMRLSPTHAYGMVPSTPPPV